MIDLYLTGQKLAVHTPLIVAGSVDYLTIQIHRDDEEWEGLSLHIFFQQEPITYELLTEGDFIGTDKHLNLTAGEWSVSVVGYDYEDGEMVEKITTNTIGLTVAPAPPDAGESLPDIPPTAYEQIEAIAQSVRDDADAGKFQGEKGDKGETAMTARVGSVTTGMPGTSASVVNSGDDKDLVFDFTIPRGDIGPQGETGPKGDTGEQGPQGEKGDKGDTGNVSSAGDMTVNGVLDITPRRCNASLSSAGWYRVLKISGYKGGWSSAVDFCVTRAYNSTNNEVHSVRMLQTYTVAPSFVNEASKSNVLNVTAIRYTVGSNGIGYVDIRYDANSANTVIVDFIVHTNPTQQETFTAEQLQAVAASPSGETVLTEYSFAANTNVARTAFTPTFSGTANPSVNTTACFYSIKDGVMYAGGRFNLASFTSGSTTVLFTLPVSLGIADRGAETIGTVFTTTKTLQLRSYGADVYITDAVGNYSGGLLNTGYWSFQIVAPIYN